MNKQEKLHAIVLDQKKLKELKVKVAYQIRMLAIQYKKLGFSFGQIADTFNKAGLTTPKNNSQFTPGAVAKLIKEKPTNE
mgnify:CR=1 FL=1|jgi:hypothetical protein|tara:strand:- start:2192 stop:2431 length:240 start_codon:yes stop_codon:yes gene_type:complete